MPTLSTNDFEKLDEFIEHTKTLLTGDVDIDDIHQAQDILAAVRQMLELGLNPDGTLPLDLNIGDRIELDTDHVVTVSGTPWKTNSGNRWTGDMIVIPVDGDPTIVTVPADVRVATA